jgi:transposase
MTSKALWSLQQWLTEQRCTHVAMEATGVYWKPVWHMLEGHVELVLANANHIKRVSGRKTDVADATWIAELLAHGLIQSSFVPPPAIQELRDLTRTRKQLVQEQTRHVQRLHKLLEDTNLKLGAVLTDIMGQSGRAVLAALSSMRPGRTDPQALQKLFNYRVKASRQEQLEALSGRVTRAHQVQLQIHLRQHDSLEQALQTLDDEITELLRPFRRSYELLLTIPGVGDRLASVVAAEIGLDMSRFPTAGRLLSWAGMCPGQNESAGKRKSTPTRKGDRWLRLALVQAAWVAVRMRTTYYRSQYLRLKTRMPAKKAIVAVAASMLKAAYYILRDQVPYKELGSDFFDRRDPESKLKRLVRQLKNLGMTVTLNREASTVLVASP